MDRETLLNLWNTGTDTSTDDYDFDALPVHIVRTDSFQGIPGHEELVDSHRGMPIFNMYGSTVVDMPGDNEFTDDYMWGGEIPRPKLTNGTAKIAANRCSWDYDSEMMKKPPSQSGEPEAKPLLLMKTHFDMKSMPLQMIECTINSFLKDMPDISFECFAEKCMWNVWAVQTQGGGSCKLQVAIYKGDNKDDFIVECNRLTGDHEPFNQFHKCLRAAFYLEEPVLQRTSTIHESFVSSMGPLPTHATLSDAEARKELVPILNLARSSFYVDMIEASKMLCGFSLDEDLKHVLCEVSCVDVLVRLAKAENPNLARQNAVTTLANLSMEHGPRQEALIEAGVLPVLLESITNGSHETAELRRESARALANLSFRLGSRVVSAVGEQQLQAWFGTLEDLSDDRVRLHAMQARDALRLVCV